MNQQKKRKFCEISEPDIFENKPSGNTRSQVRQKALTPTLSIDEDILVVDDIEQTVASLKLKKKIFVKSTIQQNSRMASNHKKRGNP